MSHGIDPNKLKECIEKSGFLLEHRSYALLHECVRKIHRQIHGDGAVGLDLLLEGNQSTEVDVFYDIQQDFSDIVERNHPIVDQIGFAKNVIFRTLLIAECKGHPSDGFVFVQKLSNNNEYTQRVFYRRVHNNSWGDEKLDTRKIYTAFGGNFFRCNRKKDLSVDAYEMEREGSHNKFFQAHEQIMCNIRAVIDNLDNLPNAPTGAQVIRIVPLLITNAPIVAMSVEKTKATFEHVPWVTHDAQFQHFGQSKGKKRDLFDLFHVVSFDFLKEFVGSLLSPGASLLPKGDLRHDIAGSDILIQ